MTDFNSIIKQDILDNTKVLLQASQIERMLESRKQQCYTCGDVTTESHGGNVDMYNRVGGFRCDTCQESAYGADEGYSVDSEYDDRRQRSLDGVQQEVDNG